MITDSGYRVLPAATTTLVTAVCSPSTSAGAASGDAAVGQISIGGMAMKRFTKICVLRSASANPRNCSIAEFSRAAGHTPSHRVDFKFAAPQHDSKSIATILAEAQRMNWARPWNRTSTTRSPSWD
jgi:hypothetical protein